MYFKEQKSTVLEIFHQTNSVRERKPLSRFANPKEHPRNPSLDVKLDAIRRCFQHGE